MAEAPDALVVFLPSGRRGRFAHGTSLLAAARSLGVDLDSVCGGRGLCGRCQVEPAPAAAPLSAPGQTEQAFRLAPGRRLSCAARVLGDVVVEVPASSRVHRQVVRKPAEAHDIRLDPAVRLHCVAVPPPDMHAPASDRRRLEQALEAEWGLTGLECDRAVLADLQSVLRLGQWKVTVAVHERRTLVAIWPGLKPRVYGLAVDVGSTTLAAQLCDLGSGEVLAVAGTTNPQMRYGEDVMSRVSGVMLEPATLGALTAAVREGIDRLARELCERAGIQPTDVLEATFVGNPVMHHLLLGLSPVELGGAPFALAVDHGLSLRASELDLGLHPGARAYLLPCIAGHVGADTAAMMLAERPEESDEVVLLVDVGTNAELVLGNRQRLLACSSPTGPAFEGAQVSCGQRAAPGAIERVRIDRRTLEPRYKVIGCDHWSDEPGFVRAGAGERVTGICGSGIVEALAELFLAGLIGPDGAFDGALAARTGRLRPEGRSWAYVLHEGAVSVRVTQADVRAIQLAKAALHAGARLLMDRYGVETIDRIRLAGAFGSHIDVLHAMVLGLIPDCPLSGVSAAGNAAGTGARVALLDRASRERVEALVRRVEKVETALDPAFQRHFVEAMAIPHRSAPSPHLAAAVDLPVAALAPPGEARRRRSPRRPAGRPG